MVQVPDVQKRGQATPPARPRSKSKAGTGSPAPPKRRRARQEQSDFEEQDIEVEVEIGRIFVSGTACPEFFALAGERDLHQLTGRVATYLSDDSKTFTDAELALDIPKVVCNSNMLRMDIRIEGTINGSSFGLSHSERIDLHQERKDAGVFAAAGVNPLRSLLAAGGSDRKLPKNVSRWTKRRLLPHLHNVVLDYFGDAFYSAAGVAESKSGPRWNAAWMLSLIHI